MTREEAIGILEESLRQNRIMRDSPTVFFKSADIVCGVKNAERRIKALGMAIAALRAQQEPNAPLTMNELREMKGKPVWVEMAGTGRYAVIRSCGEIITEFTDGGKHPNDIYGSYWLAYRRKPGEGTT